MICNLGVVGSNPTRGSKAKRMQFVEKLLQMRFLEIVTKGKFQSGQMGQTVNLLSFDFGGSNPSLPTMC